MFKVRLKYFFILFLGLGVSSFQHNYAMEDKIYDDFEHYNNNSDDSDDPGFTDDPGFIDAVPDNFTNEEEIPISNFGLDFCKDDTNKISISTSNDLIPVPNFSFYSNHSIENNTNQREIFKTPEKLKQTDSPSGLTPEINSMELSSPFGFKTPERYKNSKNQCEILDLFLFNFLKYEKKFPDNSLFTLVNFLFEKANDKKVLPKKLEISNDCKELVSNFDENFFNSLYTTVIELIESNKKISDENKSTKKKSSSLSNIKDSIYYSIMSRIQNGSKFYKTLFSVHTHPLKKNPYKVKNAEIKKNTDWKFLNDLIDSFEIILTTELYKEHYWKLCPYILGHFLKKPQSNVKKLNFDCELNNEDNNSISHQEKKQKISQKNENSDKNEENNQICFFPESFNCQERESNFFSKLFNFQERESNNNKIITAISQTPLYYLLCFDMNSNEICDIIVDIINQKHSGYKNANSEKISLLFEILIDRLIAIENCSQYIIEVFNLVYLKIIEKLPTMQINVGFCEKESNVYKSEFKPFICSAIKIGRSLKKEIDNRLKNCIFIDIDHITCVTFAPGKKVFGGGHLDLDFKIIDEDLKNQKQGFCLFKRCELGTAASSGIKIVEWLIAEQGISNRCFSNKMSSLFPACVTKDTIHKYTEAIYDAIKNRDSENKNGKITVLKIEQNSNNKDNKNNNLNINNNNNIIETECNNVDLFSKEQFMCECNENFIHGAPKMRVVVCLDNSYIDKNYENKENQDNIIPVIKTMYPCGALYFTRNENGNVFFDNELIDNEEKLNKLCKDLFRYKRNKDKNKSICYEDKNIPVYENLTLDLETLKTIKPANESFKFNRENKTKILIEVVQNVVLIEVFVQDK